MLQRVTSGEAARNASASAIDPEVCVAPTGTEAASMNAWALFCSIMRRA